MDDLYDIISAFAKHNHQPHVGAYAEELARTIENAGYTRASLTEVRRPARKVMQIAFAASSNGSWPIALCDDGTIWGMPDGASSQGEWTMFPPIPGDGA